MVASPWRCEFDTGTNEVLVKAVDVVDDETDPGPETAGVVLPVRDGPIEPHFAVADGQLHVADDTVVVWPTFALDEAENFDTPVGDCAGIGAEHV